MLMLEIVTPLVWCSCFVAGDCHFPMKLFTCLQQCLLSTLCCGYLEHLVYCTSVQAFHCLLIGILVIRPNYSVNDCPNCSGYIDCTMWTHSRDDSLIYKMHTAQCQGKLPAGRSLSIVIVVVLLSYFYQHNLINEAESVCLSVCLFLCSCHIFQWISTNLAYTQG